MGTFFAPQCPPSNGGFDLVRRGLDDKMTRKDDDMDAQVNNKSDGSEERRDRPSKSSAHTKALITRNLKLAYGEVAGEPIPKHLMDLLSAIDDSSEKKS